MRNFAILAVCAVSLSGCAGLAASFVNNPEAGNYSGTFSTSDGRSGTATLNMGTTGDIEGNFTGKSSSDTGTFNGTINKNLVLSGTLEFDRTFSESVSGTLKQVGSGADGTLSSSAGYTITLDMTKQ
jgi:hypothetical protein